MAELADAAGLKPVVPKRTWGFESLPRHGYSDARASRASCGRPDGTGARLRRDSRADAGSRRRRARERAGGHARLARAAGDGPLRRGVRLTDRRGAGRQRRAAREHDARRVVPRARLPHRLVPRNRRPPGRLPAELHRGRAGQRTAGPRPGPDDRRDRRRLADHGHAEDRVALGQRVLPGARAAHERSRGRDVGRHVRDRAETGVEDRDARAGAGEHVAGVQQLGRQEPLRPARPAAARAGGLLRPAVRVVRPRRAGAARLGGAARPLHRAERLGRLVPDRRVHGRAPDLAAAASIRRRCGARRVLVEPHARRVRHRARPRRQPRVHGRERRVLAGRDAGRRALDHVVQVAVRPEPRPVAEDGDVPRADAAPLRVRADRDPAPGRRPDLAARRLHGRGRVRPVDARHRLQGRRHAARARQRRVRHDPRQPVGRVIVRARAHRVLPP